MTEQEREKKAEEIMKIARPALEKAKKELDQMSEKERKDFHERNRHLYERMQSGTTNG